MKVQVCRHEVEGICRDQVGDALLHNESQQSLAAWLCVALLPFCTSARKVCGRPAWYGMVSMPSSAMSYD